jgi:hypothetical protein
LAIKTYAEAVSRAVPPQKLFEIVQKAVTDALGSGKRCDGARMFILRVLGADQIKVYLHGLNGSQPGSSMPVYRLDALDDAELVLLDRLSAKMTIEGGEQV